MARFESNFHRDPKGNTLFQGEDLTIKCLGEQLRGELFKPNYMTGRLFKLKSFGRKQLIQIEQTGRKSNPESDQVTFEMKNPDNTNMEKGKYRVEVKADFYPHNIYERDFKDTFEIV